MGVGGGREVGKKKEDAGGQWWEHAGWSWENMGQQTGKEAVTYSLMFSRSFTFAAMLCLVQQILITSVSWHTLVHDVFLCSTCKYFSFREELS